jgi:hypothetical protein
MAFSKNYKLNYMLFVLNFCLFSCSGIRCNFFCKNFTQAGIFSGKVITVAGETMVNNGKMVATEAIKIKYETSFGGSGYLEAPYIEITTKKFEFTGTIKCDGKCVITVQEPFDQSIFTKTGTGEFIVNVDSNLFAKKVESAALPVQIEAKKSGTEALVTPVPQSVVKQDVPEVLPVISAPVELKSETKSELKSEPTGESKPAVEPAKKEQKSAIASFFERYGETLIKCATFGIMAAIIVRGIYLSVAS